MSGGYFGYAGARIRDDLEQIYRDQEVPVRFPLLAARIEKLADWLYDVEHDIDWDLSGDSRIDNDQEFEAAALTRLSCLIDPETEYELFKGVIAAERILHLQAEVDRWRSRYQSASKELHRLYSRLVPKG